MKIFTLFLTCIIFCFFKELDSFFFKDSFYNESVFISVLKCVYVYMLAGNQ